MDSILIFVFTFIFFMIIWIVGLLIGRSISKKKLSNFRKYLGDNLPEIDPSKEEILIAKQKSKQVQPDIALLMREDMEDIILLLDVKGTGITHKRYQNEDLKAFKSTDQIISRGLFPKTHSYEETLQLDFADGNSYKLILENVSNKQGSDQGANVVRNMFAPWKRKLNNIVRE